MIKQEKNTFLIITAHSATPAVSKHIIFFTAVLTSPKHNLDIAFDLTPMCPGFKLNEFMFLLIGSGQMCVEAMHRLRRCFAPRGADSSVLGLGLAP